MTEAGWQTATPGRTQTAAPTLHTTASTIAQPGRGLGSTSLSTKPP